MIANPALVRPGLVARYQSASSTPGTDTRRAGTKGTCTLPLASQDRVKAEQRLLKSQFTSSSAAERSETQKTERTKSGCEHHFKIVPSPETVVPLMVILVRPEQYYGHLLAATINLNCWGLTIPQWKTFNLTLLPLFTQISGTKPQKFLKAEEKLGNKIY